MQAVTGFSDVEIKLHIGSCVAHSPIVEQTVLAGVLYIAHPIKPSAVNITQAARLAVIQGRDGGRWRRLISSPRCQIPEPLQRVGACGCADNGTYIQTHTHTTEFVTTLMDSVV